MCCRELVPCTSDFGCNNNVTLQLGATNCFSSLSMRTMSCIQRTPHLFADAALSFQRSWHGLAFVQPAINMSQLLCEAVGDAAVGVVSAALLLEGSYHFFLQFTNRPREIGIKGRVLLFASPCE